MSRKRMSDNPSTSSGNENADRDTTQPTPEQRSLDKSLPRTFPVQPEAPAASDSTDDKPSQSSGEADRTRQREDRVREAAHRRFDVISARAFAPLPKLLSIALPFSDKNTRWVLPKGKSAGEELEAARASWQGRFRLVPSVTDSEAAIIVAEGVTPGKRRR